MLAPLSFGGNSSSINYAKAPRWPSEKSSFPGGLQLWMAVAPPSLGIKLRETAHLMPPLPFLGK